MTRGLKPTLYNGRLLAPCGFSFVKDVRAPIEVGWPAARGGVRN